jgi:hypothetical protein
VIGQLSVGTTGTVQPLRNGAVDDPAANLIGQIVCDVLVGSAALGQTDDQEAFTDFGVGFLAEGVVEPLSFLQRQADANQGIKVPLVG